MPHPPWLAVRRCCGLDGLPVVNATEPGCPAPNHVRMSLEGAAVRNAQNEHIGTNFDTIEPFVEGIGPFQFRNPAGQIRVE